jgi:hypothetical protein
MMVKDSYRKIDIMTFMTNKGENECTIILGCNSFIGGYMLSQNSYDVAFSV